MNSDGYVDDIIEMLNKYGDDVAKYIAKYGDDAAEVIQDYGDEAIEALKDGKTPEEIKTVVIVPDIGFGSFDELKKYLGAPGEGHQWHHIVEQSQIGKRANFSSEQVNNVNNVISIPSGSNSIYSKISAHYSSKFEYTNNLTVRDWLADKSFAEQFEYGKELLEEYGEVVATKSGWIFKPYE